MPLQFAAPGSLARGRRPVQVPPPSGAMVSPAANELPALAQVTGDNLHLQATTVEPLDRPIDPTDLEAAGKVADPTQLGPMATRAVVRTQVMDTPQQAMQRASQMGGNRADQQLQTEMQTAGALVEAVTAPQQAQKMLGQQRLMSQQMAQAGGGDMTGAMANAQAMDWSARYRAGIMDERQKAAIDDLADKMQRGGSQFAIGA